MQLTVKKERPCINNLIQDLEDDLDHSLLLDTNLF